MTNLDLLSTTSRVEAPVINVKIGNYEFGRAINIEKGLVRNNRDYTSTKIAYPNFVKSLRVTKTNGLINQYELQLVYAISVGDDPNFIDKVLSSISKTRKIIFTYGDSTLPNFLFREEEAVITDVTTSFDIHSSVKTYTIQCVSGALSASAGKLSFGRRVNTKPSDVIKEILYVKQYGLLDIFYGMRDKSLVLSNNLIAGDDKPVTIEAKKLITILDYLNYLVDCMVPMDTSDTSILSNARYALNIVDDISQIFHGPYFQIKRIDNNIKNYQNLDTYTIDIGTYSKDAVIDFTIQSNEAYSILYEYSVNNNLPDYIYRIDNNGDIKYDYSPSISNSSDLMKTTQADKV